MAWRNWKNALRKLFIVASALTVGVSCEDEGAVVDGIEDETATPLPQESIVPVEIDVNGVWVTMPVPQVGIEQLARTYCYWERVETTDIKACSRTVAGDLVLQDFEGSAITPAAAGSCKAATCWLRNEVCAGMMLEEAARSPLPRVLESDVVGNPFDLTALLLVPTNARTSALVAAGVSDTINTTTRIRFQPLKAPGRAAVLRGALNRYREAGVIGELMSVPQDDPPTDSCLDVFAPSGGVSLETPLEPDDEAHIPTWADLYYASLTDAASEFSGALFRTLDAMRDSAESGVRGANVQQDEIATQWNGKVDSALAIAKLLGTGESEEAGGSQFMSVSSECGEDHKADDIGPKGLPVCPPIVNDEVMKTVVKLMGVFQSKPHSIDFEFDFVESANANYMQQGLISAPLPKEQVYANLGITSTSVLKAGVYQCNQAKLTGTFLLPAGTITSGSVSAPKYSGVFKPTGTLSAPIVSSHFTGTAPIVAAGKIGARDYSKSGAIRTLDSFRSLTKRISTHPASGAVKTKLLLSILDVVAGLAEDAGKRRIEFVIGRSVGLAEGTAIDNFAVIIHGVPGTNATTAAEKYLLVQGLKGLKCVQYGNIDGAPCTASDYIVDLNAVGTYTDAPPKMPDLDGGYLRATFTTGSSGAAELPQKGNPNSPVLIEHGIYVLRVEGGKPVAFGGVVPGPGPLVLGGSDFPWPDYVSWATRLVITPVGGTFEQVLQNAVTPNSDDCSKVQTTCAGLPADIWPPLESEIVGTPSANVPFEQSYKFYLDLAKQASAEADALGEEMLEQGLQMDLRSEEMQAKLEELCGADIASCGVGGLGTDEPVFATLGDRGVCLWDLGEGVCNATSLTATQQAAIPCPFLLDPETAVTDSNCDAFATTNYGPIASATFTAVTTKLGLVPSVTPTGASVTGCLDFAELRANPDLKDREERIRTILQSLPYNEVKQIAHNLRYYEYFGDNYRLEYPSGSVIFDTRRGAPGTPNGNVGAPCNVSTTDQATGSDFWNTPVDCFESGDGTPPVCDAGEGKDGCSPVSKSDLSLDTEQAALRHRWAWGFGHLRRAVGTLGVITGELNEMMSVARVFNVKTAFVNGGALLATEFNNGGGYASSTKLYEPLWVRHPTKGGAAKAANVNDARCVELLSNGSGVGGVGTDSNRLVSGRPVNQNAWIPNVLSDGPGEFTMFDGTKNADTVVTGFPILCFGGACAAGGVDPQMPYCQMASPTEIAAAAALNGGEPFSTVFTTRGDSFAVGGNERSSGYIGTLFSRPAKVASFSNGFTGWSTAVDQIWADPGSDVAFCQTKDPTVASAAWRSLCFAPQTDPPSLASNVEFLQRGTIPAAGNVLHADRATVGEWLSPGGGSGVQYKYSQMLFDLSKGDPRTTAIPFQYPLTERNVFDALELACHVRARSQLGGAAVNCDDLELNNLGTLSMDQLAGVLDCLKVRIQRASERFTVGPLPKSVVDAFIQNTALSPTAGTGGKYLASQSAQINALKRVGADYAKIRDATSHLALAIKELDSLADEQDLEYQSAIASSMAVWFGTFAQAAFQLAQVDAIKATTSLGGNAAATTTGIGFLFASAVSQTAAIALENKIADEGIEQKRLAIAGKMLDYVSNARDAADDITPAMNDLSLATADQKLVLKQAAKATAGMKFADIAYDPSGKADPQFVNIVMRRMFNTRLLRYETAFERAKRLAYLARRAIELRFGVDLQKIDQPMSLVDAPSHWANSICDLQGIDYSKVRQPNAANPVTEAPPGSKPIPGDDFANAYVGDYVKKLEDFVTSYPIDNPLTDGDDTAVISLADDVFKVSLECSKPGRNLLYFSTEFEKSDGFTLGPDTQGWGVEGCGLDLPATDAAPAEPWTGCIDANPIPLEAETAPGGDGGVSDAGPALLTHAGLPSNAVAYRVRNQTCDTGLDSNGQTLPCPSVSQYYAAGAVVQYLADLEPGTHVASVYALPDPAGTFGSPDGGPPDAPEIRIVRVSDGMHIESALTLDPSEWKRTEISFDVESGEVYRLEIRPSVAGTPLAAAPDAGTPTWPSVYLAAAQVERAGVASDGTVDLALNWVRTDLSRDTIDPVCNELRGPALRKQFERHCEYVCKDGISKQCAAAESNSKPVNCFYEAHFSLPLEKIESGELIPSGQIAIGNFNFRSNLAGVNAVGTGLASCDGKPTSCYYNGFLEYTLVHSGTTLIRNYTGGSLPAKLDTAFIEHGKMLAAERVITNPPSGTDLTLIEPYMKHELKGRPLNGLYTIRVWDKPGLRWDRLEDLQLVWKYHYWTRFQSNAP